MNTYTWNITSVMVIPSENDVQNVVKKVDYTVTGVSETGISESILGSVLFDTVNYDNFTPFNELNKDTILSWLQGMLNVENIQAQVDEKITITQDKLNLPVAVDLPQ